MKPEQQQKVRLAADAAARYNNTNRIKDEAELVDFFKSQGIKVITPDVAAFRKAVQEKYLASDMAKNWEKGLLQRIIDVK
jgi:TRAP-type C4-dicarboxylate transport system substrate-binding protein